MDLLVYRSHDFCKMLLENNFIVYWFTRKFLSVLGVNVVFSYLTNIYLLLSSQLHSSSFCVFDSPRHFAISLSGPVQFQI